MTQTTITYSNAGEPRAHRVPNPDFLTWTEDRKLAWDESLKRLVVTWTFNGDSRVYPLQCAQLIVKPDLTVPRGFRTGYNGVFRSYTAQSLFLGKKWEDFKKQIEEFVLVNAKAMGFEPAEPPPFDATETVLRVARIIDPDAWDNPDEERQKDSVRRAKEINEIYRPKKKAS